MATFHCYYAYSFSSAPEEHGGMGPCGQPGSSNIRCCGIGEKCMSDGICAYTGQDSGGSGYYIGGCTDKTMQDPNCAKNCTSYGNSDVVYDYNIGQWRCCGTRNGSRSCDDPEGNPLFNGAPAPLDLLYVATVVATGSSIPLATRVQVLSSTSGNTNNASPATATVTVTASPGSSQVSSSSGLSPGAAAGIAVAAVLATCIVVLLSTWFFFRRKGYRLQKPPREQPLSTSTPSHTTPVVEYYPAETKKPTEAPRYEVGRAPHSRVHELGVELEGR